MSGLTPGTPRRCAQPDDPDRAGTDSAAAGDVATGRSPRGPQHRPTWQRPGLLAAVATGGVLGACGRYEVGLALPTRHGSFPVATFIVNISGSFVLGVLLTLMIERWRPNEYVRPFVATGIIGAYTTWSTFVAEADTLVKNGHIAMAVGYVAASLSAGLLALYAGILLGRGALPTSHRTSEK